VAVFPKEMFGPCEVEADNGEERVGTSIVPSPGAILCRASRLRCSISSILERKNVSLRAECAAIVERREPSSVTICGSSVNG
jgi:hypothetical protein